ncbi:MAG: hypothetical protein ACK5QT_01725 [Oligoflexia bacterium]
MDVGSKSGPSKALGDAQIEAQRRARAETEKRTRQVERDARQRMEVADKHATQVEREQEMRVERTRQQTSSQIEAELAKRQATVGKLKNETYHDVAELKRRAAAENAKIRSEAERRLETTQATFDAQTDLAEYEGRKQLKETLTRNARLQSYQDQAAENERQILKQSHNEEMKALEKSYTAQKLNVQQQGDAEIERLQNKAAEGRQEAEKRFESHYRGTLGANAEAIGRTQAEAKKQLDSLRQSHSESLSQYEARLEDPFYRMVDLGLQLRDRGDYYELEARIPAHEREHLKVTVRGGSIMVSGARRNEESLKLEEGGTRKISSFQTYQESLPLDWPVEAQSMLQEFDGDRLKVTIPKKGAYIDSQTGKKRPLDPEPYSAARAPRPDFPPGVPSPAAKRPDKPIG